MGYNTSMIILNDGLDQIKKDPEFGSKVAAAAARLDVERWQRSKAGLPFYGVDVSAGCHGNAATVLETHHADATSVVAFGGNRGLVLAEYLYAYGEEEEEVRILKALADKLGYQVRRKPTPQTDL